MTDSVTVRFIATPPAFAECLCYRCDRPLGHRAASIWDGIGSDGSVELELVCEKCGHRAIRDHTGEWVPGWAMFALRVLRIIATDLWFWTALLLVIACILINLAVDDIWLGVLTGLPTGYVATTAFISIGRKIRDLD